MSSRQAHRTPLRIAITGVTGFVGSHLVRQLAARGHDITALVRDRSRLSKKFPASAGVVEGALDDRQAVDELVGGAEVVVHVAGAIKAIDAAQFMKVNADGTRAVVEAAARAGVTRFVHVSSLAAREPDLSGYCGSKAAAESIVAASAGDMDWICVRPPAVYGPGDRATLPLVQQLSRRHAILTGTHDQRISLLHVEDLARGLVAAAEGLVEGGTVYEADDGTPQGYSWEDVAAAAGHSLGFTPRVHLLPRLVVQMAGAAGGMIARITGKAQILTVGKARELYHRDWVIKGTRLDATGHWQPGMKFDEGFAGTLGWYRAHGWLPAR
ncbi:MAG: NAD-dependent epimerase/dehydratase family protein [Pseudomonadota bacterium]